MLIIILLVSFLFYSNVSALTISNNSYVCKDDGCGVVSLSDSNTYFYVPSGKMINLKTGWNIKFNLPREMMWNELDDNNKIS